DGLAPEVLAALDRPLRGSVLRQKVTPVDAERLGELGGSGSNPAPAVARAPRSGDGPLEPADVDLARLDCEPVGIALARDQAGRVDPERLGQQATQRRHGDVEAARPGRAVDIRP